MFARTALSLASCLLAAAAAAPATPDVTTPVTTSVTTPGTALDAVVSQSGLLHTAAHRVTRLGVLFGPSGGLENNVIFYIESNDNEQGERTDYGLYASTKESKDSKDTNRTVTKLLDAASDILVINLTGPVYFAGKDGIYIYNKEKNSAEKYGSVEEEVISVAVNSSTLYYVNRQHQLYSLNEDGSKATIVDAVSAEQITFDYNGRMYYTADNKVYVYDGENAKRVEDISDAKKIWLMRTPMMAGEYGFLMADDQFYMVQGSNASARAMGDNKMAASAVSADAGLVAYFAVDRNIYEFNIIQRLVEGLMGAVTDGLKNMMRDIRNSFNSVFGVGLNL